MKSWFVICACPVAQAVLQAEFFSQVALWPLAPIKRLPDTKFWSPKSGFFLIDIHLITPIPGFEVFFFPSPCFSTKYGVFLASQGIKLHPSLLQKW